MKIFFFLIFLVSFSLEIPFEFYKSLLFSEFIKNENKTNNRTDILNPDDPEMLGKAAVTIIMELINKIIDEPDNNMSEGCKNFLKGIDDSKNYSEASNDTIRDTKFKSREAIIKVILDSSKSRNELSYYRNCINENLTYLQYNTLINNYGYFIIIVSTKNLYFYKAQQRSESKLDYEDHFYLKGYCVPTSKDCNRDDYKELVENINKKFNYFFYPENSTVEVLLVSEHNNIENLELSIIFLVIFCLLISLVLFEYPIFLLLKIFFQKEKNVEINKDEDNDKLIKKDKKNNKYILPKWLMNYHNCFSINKNLDELYNFSTNSTSVNNYSGLMEIRGLNAISMDFTILGFTFITIFNSPLKLTGISQTFLLLNHLLYSFIFIGIRFSPRIILSCSGYTLMYKYLCYLDKYNSNFSIIKFASYQSHKFCLFIVFFFSLDIA